MGEYTDNNYFYLPTYKAKGLSEKEKFDDALKATDSQIATNKSDISTIKKEIFSNSYTFADRLSEIGSTDTELIINSEIAINSNTTVPANVTLNIRKSGKFTVASGVTLTINGAIKAGLYQIFDGEGTVSGSPKVEAVYPEWFGAVGGGTTDDTEAIQAAVDFCEDICSPVYLFQNYKITSTLIVNLAKISLIGYRAKIDATSISSEAILVVGNNNPPYTNSPNKISGVILEGDKATYPSSIGIKFHTNSSNLYGASHTTIEKCNISNFGQGFYFGDKSYIIEVKDSDIYRCSTCVYTPSGVSDGGEKIAFSNCTIYNSTIGCDLNNSSSDFYFINCSFDFLEQFIKVNATKCFCYNCHFEWDGSTDNVFYCDGNGGQIIIDGGVLLYNGLTTLSSIVYTNNGYNTIRFSKTLFHSLKFTNFLSGSGNLEINKLNFYNIDNIGKGAVELINNADFDEIKDLVFITDDTDDITDQYTGTNIILSETASGLKVAKKYGSGSNSAFTLAVPIYGYKRAGISFDINNTGLTGTMYITYGYGIIDKFNGLPKVLKNQSQGSVSLDMGSISSTTESAYLKDNYFNEATHFLISFNLNSVVGASDYSKYFLLNNVSVKGI